MARKSKKKKWARRAELKVRLPEPLRLNLEIAARRAGRSMNAEAVFRLSESVLGNRDPYSIAAEAILNGLDQRIVSIIEDMILRANAEKEVRALYRKDAEKDLASGEPSELSPPAPGRQPSPGYETLIRRVVASETSADARRTVYERARAAFEQMHGREPPLPEAEIARERMALEGAIRKVEAEAVHKVRTGARPRSIALPDEEPELPMASTRQSKGGKS